MGVFGCHMKATKNVTTFFKRTEAAERFERCTRNCRDICFRRVGASSSTVLSPVSDASLPPRALPGELLIVILISIP